MKQMLNVDKIRSFLEKKQPKNHPILEHPLEQQEEYVQMLYIDILCIFAQYDNAGITSALNFVQRLMAGLNMTEPVTDHMTEAMELSVERFEEFIVQCQEHKLEDIFLLDAMLLSCAAGAPKKKQLEFLAQTADALRLSKSRVEWLSRLACVILEQDSEAYHGLCDELPDDFRNSFLTQIVCYLKQFIVGVVVDTDELLYIYAPEKTVYDLTSNGVLFTNRNVIFENLIIMLKKDWQNLKFQNCDTVLIRNCAFSGCLFELRAVSNVTLTNCEFEGYNGFGQVLGHPKFVDFLGGNQLDIKNCYFHDIVISGGSTYALIHNDSIHAGVSVNESRFEKIENCGHSYPAIIIFAGMNAHFDSCQFINCKTGEQLIGKFNTLADNCEFRECCSPC